MPDAFWNNLPAIIGAIVAALAWFQSLRNGEAARVAAEKAKVAAAKTEEVQAALQENTDLTAKVDRQTNGMSDRQQKLLERMADQIEGNTTSVKAVGLRVARLEDRLDRIEQTKGGAA